MTQVVLGFPLIHVPSRGSANKNSEAPIKGLLPEVVPNRTAFFLRIRNIGPQPSALSSGISRGRGVGTRPKHF